MLNYFKFRQDLFDLALARDVYIKRGKGRGWPEECPPIRGANAFGFDVLANFDLTFVRSPRGQTWSVKRDVVIESDFEYARSERSEGQPLVQQYAWFWEKGQKLPHVITDNVYREISNQVKVSSFLFLKTDPDELLLVTEVPNLRRKWRAMSALIETDWYPASYPWHVVLELDPRDPRGRDEKRITIRKGEPLARIIPVRRDEYRAAQMSPAAFEEFFERGQEWLAAHGKFEHETADAGDARVADITGTYRKQQKRAKFVVLK
jgi:hypothetical protein